MAWAIPKPDSSKKQSNTFVKPEQREIPGSLKEAVTPEISASPRIVGGTPASRGEFPEYGSLLVDGLDGFLYILGCGSTLISSNKVLTAAHCTIDYSAYRLYVIPENYSYDDYIPMDQIYQVNYKNEHPGFDSVSTNSDISILDLKRHPNAELTKIYGGSNNFSGHMATIIGLGVLSNDGPLSSVLYKANVPIVSNAVCAKSYDSYEITSSMLCAGYSYGGVDSCQGDSGGPLFVISNGQRVQAGIVSWGIGCALPSYYGVYTHTSALVSFIRQYAPAATIVEDPTPTPTPTPAAFLPAIYVPLLFE
ncbi:MAG: serine protease [Gammaproteobacteria bacterium]|nr:serine protease [Gammaproteobacteria bacterium]